MEPMRFALAALAVWRLTHLLQAEDGPWDLVVRLRRLAGRGFFGSLLDCFQCLSLWVAVPGAALAGASGWRQWLLAWPALSGAAILLERLGRAQVTPALFPLDAKEEPHVLLREQPEPPGRP